MATVNSGSRAAAHAPSDDEAISTREKYRRIAEHRRYPKKRSYTFDDLALGMTAMEAGVNRYYAMHAGRPAKRVLDYLAQAAKATKPETKTKAVALARKCFSDLSRERHPELAEQIAGRLLWEEGWRPETWDAARNAPRNGPSINPETGVQEFFFDGEKPTAAPVNIPQITVKTKPLQELFRPLPAEMHFPVDVPWSTRKYGPDKDPVTGLPGFHNGTDFRNPKGSPVYSTQKGAIISVSPSPKGGNQIIVRNDDGSISGYAHTQVEQGFDVGSPVDSGQKIGASDESGVGTKAHLHYTYRPSPNSERIDPLTGQLKETRKR